LLGVQVLHPGGTSTVHGRFLLSVGLGLEQKLFFIQDRAIASNHDVMAAGKLQHELSHRRFFALDGDVTIPVSALQEPMLLVPEYAEDNSCDGVIKVSQSE
jgi:hypothetical protein